MSAENPFAPPDEEIVEEHSAPATPEALEAAQAALAKAKKSRAKSKKQKVEEAQAEVDRLTALLVEVPSEGEESGEGEEDHDA